MHPASVKKLKFNPQANVRGSVRNLDLSVLEIDSSYQRGERDPLVKAIAMNWDWAALKTPNVAQRPDGSYFVTDGQQEVAAARLRGDIETLPCYIVPIKSVAIEAEAFRMIQMNRKPLTKLECHRAHLVAKFPLAVAIEAAAAEAGVEFSSSAGVGRCNGIGSIMAHFKSTNPTDAKAKMAQMFRFANLTWPEDEKVLTGRSVVGLLRFLTRIEEEGRSRVMARPERLGAHSMGHYLRKAGDRAAAYAGSNKESGSVIGQLPTLLRETFNNRLDEKNRI